MSVNSWRDRIVRKLEAAPGRLTLVADPDDLLLEEQMLQRTEPTSMPSSRPSSAIRSPQRLGDRETRSYVLRHIFGVAPETIGREEHLLRFLLGRHYRGLRIPADIDGQLVRLLEKRTCFREWRLASIIPDREAFFAFLQERWPPFLDRLAVPAAAREDPPSERYEIQIPGPVQVAFDHDDVRIYIDNLFHEGLLKSVPHPKSQRLAGSWTMVGVTTDPSADRLRRMRGLLHAVEETVPGEGAAHRQWLDFACRWAELRVLKGAVSDAGSRGGARRGCGRQDHARRGSRQRRNAKPGQVLDRAEDPHRLLDTLLSADFSVFLTSDHGNIETRGCGGPAEGVLVETYGKHVRVYDDPVLRDRVLEKFPNAIPWRRVGLPDGYHALLAPGRFSFVREDEKPVAHGGASLEEVIVPLVEIEAT